MKSENMKSALENPLEPDFFILKFYDKELFIGSLGDAFSYRFS